VAVFPVFLKLEGRRVLVVGAGPVAAGKLRALLDSGARVTVVAPHVAGEIAALSDEVEIIRRPFEPRDVEGVWYVVAAAPPAVNRSVARAAEARGLFVNAVDDLESASAYAGAVVQRAGVTIALSTDGEAPALAGLLREALDVLLPDDLDLWMTCARDARRTWLAERVPMAERRPLLLQALNDLYERKRAQSAASSTGQYQAL
jgi:siroheme synthase-like protein